MTDLKAIHSGRAMQDREIGMLLEEACSRTGMGFAAVARVTEREWTACQIVDHIEFGLDPGDELDLQTTICDEIRKSGRGVIIDHVADDPEWRKHPVPMLYGFQSYVSLPLYLADGAFFGTFCLIDMQPRALSAPGTVATLREIADRIAARLRE